MSVSGNSEEQRSLPSEESPEDFELSEFESNTLSQKRKTLPGGIENLAQAKRSRRGEGDDANPAGNGGAVIPLWTPECNRGGRLVPTSWELSARPAELKDARAFQFISSLVSPSEIEASGNRTWVQALKDTIQQKGWDSSRAFIDNSVFSIAQRCSQGEVICASAVFAHMVSNIQLVIAENRFVLCSYFETELTLSFSLRFENPTLTSSRKIWDEHLADSFHKNLPGVPNSTKFCGFITDGTKLSQLAAAGEQTRLVPKFSRMLTYDFRFDLHSYDIGCSRPPARILKVDFQVCEDALQSDSESRSQ